MIEELKPCPFCGGEDITTFGPYGWYHQWGISHSCASFYSGTSEMCKGFQSEADAIAAWNARPSSPEAVLREALEGVRGFLMSAPLESGICCCGDTMEGHGTYLGHSPVDELTYAAMNQVERIDAALAQTQGEEG